MTKHLRLFAIALLLLAFHVDAQAQISFSEDYFTSKIGKPVAKQLSFWAPNNQDATLQALADQTGENQTWNFSALTFNTEADSSVFQEYIALPANLPGSNDARVANATFAIRGVIDSQGQQDGDEYIVYFSTTSTEFHGYGTYAVVDGQDFDGLYNTPLLENPLPLAYGVTWENETSYTHSSQGVTVNITQEQAGNANGWGTLITPSGSAEALRYELAQTLTTTVSGQEIITTARIINFVTKEGHRASITITPGIFGLPDLYTASYSVEEGTSPGGGNPPQNAPTDLVPADQASDVATTATVMWGTVANANSYDLQVSNTSFSMAGKGHADLIVNETGLNTTSYEVSNMENNTVYYWRVRGVNTDGPGPWAEQQFTTVTATAIEEGGSDVPEAFKLYPSYPNPFNPETTIRFDLPESAMVTLSVYDALGHEVTTLVAQPMNPGQYSYTWNAATQPSGMYIYRLQAGAYSHTGTMMLVK